MRSVSFALVVAICAGACAHVPWRPEPGQSVAMAPSPAGATNSDGTVAILPSPSSSPGGLVSARDTARPPAPRDTAPPGVGSSVTALDSVSSAELTREAARVFGDSASPPATDTAAAPGAPLWDIDVRSYETRKIVEDYVRIFSGRAKSVFEVALQRQTRYGPMMRERLNRTGLPEDLTYLALVESWFNPHAYSRAAAVGFWQFMAGTARGMGLRVDWWVDERRDPVRSTEAAARLLAGLRDEFGSLYLAAAAYNGGSGRVSRGLARYASALDGVEGEDRFFALAEQSYLRPETRDYVPKIIAAALVGEEPERYGVHVDSLPALEYDSVRVPGGTPLAAVANALAIKGSELAELNPHVLRGMTPPADSMWVRVPAGSADADFAERFSALEPGERQALARFTSRKGQTMLSIARAHGITQQQLGWYNPKVVKLRSGALRAGQVMLVPRRDVVAAARDVPNPSVERYPRRRSVLRRHVVASGETLSGIAKKYKVTVPTLKRLNGLKGDRVMPGQSLVLAGAARSAARKPAVKKPAVKKPAVKKPAVKKPAVKKPAVKKPAVKKPAVKKPAVKKPAKKR